MKYLSAYLLASLNTEEAPTKERVTSILSSVGIESDKDRVNALFAALEGKDIATLISEGQGKLASVSTVSVGASSGGGAAPAAAAGGKAEVKKEEKKEEKAEEESDEEMGFGLFD